MIPYEDLVAVLDEVNGRVTTSKTAAQHRETGSMRTASEPQRVAIPESSTVTAEVSDLFEEPAAPAQLRDMSLLTAEPEEEEPDMIPLATAEPELQESFEVLTEEPLPPPAEDASDFDILAESDLPSLPTPEKPSQLDEVLGDNAFSHFFESAQDEKNVSNDLFDAPTPPPEDSNGDFLPPPPEDFDNDDFLPPPPEDWK